MEEHKEHHPAHREGRTEHHVPRHPVHHRPQPQEEKMTITLTKSSVWQAATGILGVLLVLSVFTGGFGFGGDGSVSGGGTAPQPSAAPSPAAAPTPTAAPSRVDVELGDAPFKGDKNAPVTIVEFSDFQCPFCGRFYSDTLGQIEKEYIDTGKAKLVYMHFPLDSIHPQATPAALASECAREQGKFWEYHDKIFENQGSLSEAGYKQWAADLGLDTGKFDSCYNDQKYLSRVRDQLQAGSDAGIRGTPGFVINGQVVSGAQPFLNFQRIIDAELA